MNDQLFELFDKLSDDLTKVENKHNVGDDSEDAIPEFEVVAGLDYKNKVKGNDQTGDESGKIAALNDRFRQNQSAEDGEINGKWIMGGDVIALPPPTKAAIKRKIAEFEDFEDCPLHNRGDFLHISKDKTYPVIWQIKVFEDDLLKKEATEPSDPRRSYRVMLVDLSDDKKEAGS